jgi:hypothetical protein
MIFARPFKSALVMLIFTAGFSWPANGETVHLVELSEKPLKPDANNAALISAIGIARKEIDAGSDDTVVLRLPAGTFPFTLKNKSGITLEDCDLGNKHLIIRGAGTGRNGTRIVFDFPDVKSAPRSGCFTIRRSRGITLEQMEITRSRLSSSQGTVESIGKSTIRFRLHEGFPDPITILAGAGRNERTLLSYQPDRPLDPMLSPYATKYHVLTITNVPGQEGLFEAQINDRQELTRVKVGDWISLKVKAGEDTIFFEDSDHCAVRDVCFTRAAMRPIAGMGNNHDLLIERVSCLRPEPIQGRGACYSSPGGGIIIQTGGEGNLVIRDCTIVGTADDGIAIFSVGRQPRGSSAPPSITARITIEGNSIRDNEGRGILICQSRKGICRSNSVLRCDGPSILIKNETLIKNEALGKPTPPLWSVQDWSIEKNTLDGTAGNPLIAFSSEVPDTAKHRGIRIAGNIFKNAPQLAPVLLVSHAEDITICDNIIESFAPNPVPPAMRAYSGSSALVYSKECEHIAGNGNRLKVPSDRPACSPPGLVDWQE